MKVDAVLTVGDCMESKFPSDLEYKIIHIIDEPDSDLKQHFQECIEFIDRIVKSEKRIYVHCAQGVSRSASAVLAYMMATKKISLDEATKLVSAKRPCIHPNDGFIAQLKLFEQDLKTKTDI